MQQKNLLELKNKGYTVIKNMFDSEQIKKWKELVAVIEKEVILEWAGIKNKKKDDAYSSVVYKENNHPYMLRCTGKLQTKTEGLEIIKYFENEFRKINDDVRFIKDRIINQKKDYQGLLPHQDNPSSFHHTITNEFYSSYISLTDTSEKSGCIWVEDIQPKRTSSLNYCDDGCAAGKTCSCLSLKITPIDIKTYKGHNMIPIELKSGDCLMFDGYLLHGTAANMTDNIRQTLIFGYGALSKNLQNNSNILKDCRIPQSNDAKSLGDKVK